MCVIHTHLYIHAHIYIYIYIYIYTTSKDFAKHPSENLSTSIVYIYNGIVYIQLFIKNITYNYSIIIISSIN